MTLLKRTLSFSVVSLLFGAQNSFADLGGIDDPDLFTLIQLMETDLATKTTLQDPDKAPGLVSVLNGSELRAKGYALISDALQHQAGFDMTTDTRGLVVPSIRGIGGVRSGASGKVKVMINGVDVNFVRSGAAGRVLNLPVSVVEKVEIIRGPGSAVHGEYAYAAVINVITRKGDTEIGLHIGEDGVHMAHGIYNYASESGINLDVVAQWNDSDAEVKTGEDVLYLIGQGDISNAPGYSNEYTRQKFLSMAASYENTEVIAVWSEHARSDFFGLSSALATNDNDELRNFNEFWSLHASQAFTLNEDVQLNVGATAQKFNGDFRNVQVQPAGFEVQIPPIPEFQFPGLTVVYPDGILSNTYYEEERLSFSADLQYSGIEDHVLLFGVNYKNIEDTRSEGEINLDLTNPNPIFAQFPTPELQRFPGSIATIDEGKVRRISSVFVQDEYRVTDSLAITSGLRFDSYSDVDDVVTPRVAAVYGFNDSNTLKFQYAEAFRPPTYSELFSRPTVAQGNPDIEPETIKTTELAWIYKTENTVVRATAFYSDMDNLILLASLGGGLQQFENSAGAITQGLEIETEYSFSESWRLDTNISFTDSQDKVTDTDLEGVADILANVNIVYQPSVDWSVNTHLNYVGERHRSSIDPRSDLDAYTTVDVSVNAFNFIYPGITVKVGVNNLFDEDVVSPAPIGSYADDFPRPGRAAYIGLSKAFK